MYETILVPTDGSDHANRAFDSAITYLAVNGEVCRWTPGLSTILWKASSRRSRSLFPTSGRGDGSPLQNQT